MRQRENRRVRRAALLPDIISAMTNRRDHDFAPTGPSKSGLLWAVALTAAALLIGVVVLWRHTPSVRVTARPVASDTVAATTGDTTIPGDPNAVTTTLLPARLPATIKVIVTNGSGVNKAARKVNDALVPSGYTMVAARDAKAKNLADGVYFKDGFELEARTIASQLGVPIVIPMPLEQTIKTPPVIPAFDIQVMVGPTLAAKYAAIAAVVTPPAGAVVATTTSIA